MIGLVDHFLRIMVVLGGFLFAFAIWTLVGIFFYLDFLFI
jgi:hypothetical protein